MSIFSLVNVNNLKLYMPSMLIQDEEGQVLPSIKYLALDAKEKLPKGGIFQKKIAMKERGQDIRTCDRMLGSTSDPALPTPLPNHPLRTKASILCCLPLVDMVIPSPWITCRAFLLLSTTMTMCLWSLTDSQRWP